MYNDQAVLPRAIIQKIKYIAISILLRLLRLSLVLKPGASRIARFFLWPFSLLFGVIISLLVPVYRLFLGARRSLQRIARPAKNKIMVFLTHRYVIHVIVTTLVGAIILMNIGASDVKAETFGERSLMYQLVAEEKAEIIEERALTEVEILDRNTVRYRQDYAFSSFDAAAGAVFVPKEQTSIVGGSPVIAIPTASTDDSSAPRTKIETYVVEPGDTCGGIAEKFNLDVNTIIWANNLRSSCVVRVGATLTILPVDGITHQVKNGDTVSKIAKNYGGTTEQILSFNGLPDAGSLTVGETLIVPGGKPIVTVVTAPRPSTSGGSSAVTPSPVAPKVTGSGTMTWPTDLTIITQKFGWSHTGIDIDCGYTNNNYAAADGIVKYSGWRNGYGETVEVDHGNGLVTRYAHHAKRYVVAGQQVVKGEAVGLCGTTGRSTGTHLHFEVMVNGKFMNPLSYVR